jgi:hypothetical protein
MIDGPISERAAAAVNQTRRRQACAWSWRAPCC